MAKKSEREKLRDKLVWAVRKVLWEGDSWGDDLERADSAMWFMRNGWTLWLSESEAREYQTAIQALTEYTPLARSYSQRNLIADWQSLLVEFVDEYEDEPDFETIVQKVEDWLESALTAEEQTFVYHAVVDNLNVEEARRVGRVMFSPVTEEREANIKGQLMSVIDGNTYYDDKPVERSTIKEDILGSLKDFSASSENVLASVEITVQDVDRGKELALEAIEESLNLLRYLGAQRSGRIPRPLGIQGTVGEGKRIIPAVSDKIWKLYHERVGFTFELKRLRWARAGGFELEEILQKQPSARDELESKLVGALVWLARSVDDLSETSRLLKVWISMEMLLTAEDERTPGGTVGERMAFLLESLPEPRREVVKIMKEIYLLRNELVHKGQAKNDEEVAQYLPYARALAGRTLTRVATLREKESWSEFTQLKEYVEQLKYG